jgi:hypothetical protein
LILPHIVAGAVTIGVRATQHSRGGPQMLKPLTHFRRNVRELPPVHCGGGSHANCTEHERSDEWSNLTASGWRHGAAELSHGLRALSVPTPNRRSLAFG